MTERRILVVEDDEAIREGLADALRSEGYEVLTAATGHDGLHLGLREDPDLVVLDINLPGLDGFEVLRRLRADAVETPVLLLTARGLERDRVRGLDLGADDYVVKPFNPAEVAARVRAVLRRTLRASRVDAPTALRAGPLLIDSATHAVHVEGEGYSHEVLLTLTEFKLLHCMALAPTRIFSRSELMHECLPESEALERTVDSHVSKLRRKLDEVGMVNVPASVRGVGYRLMADR